MEISQNEHIAVKIGPYSKYKLWELTSDVKIWYQHKENSNHLYYAVNDDFYYLLKIFYFKWKLWLFSGGKIEEKGKDESQEKASWGKK